MVSPTLALTLFALSLVTCTELDSRMYNGEEIGDEFKFLLEIEVYYPILGAFSVGACSGSILDRHWIITAAHCVSNPNSIQDIRVSWFGNAPATSVVSVSRSNITSHPSFVSSKDGTSISLSSIKVDLALLRTTEPIQFHQDVQPIPLGKLSARGRALVAGYGQPVNQPRKGEMMLTYCPEYMALCSKRSGYMPRIGHGDSGGPVVMNGVLVGVVSSSARTGVFTHVNLFADIESNYDWIQSVIKTH